MSELENNSNYAEEVHWNGVGRAFLSYFNIFEFSLKEREKRLENVQQVYQLPSISNDKFKIIGHLAQNNQDFFDDMVHWYYLLTHSLTR